MDAREVDGFDAASSYQTGCVLISLMAAGHPIKGVRLTLPEAKDLEFRLRRAIVAAKKGEVAANGPA